MALRMAQCMGLHRLGSALQDEERWAREKKMLASAQAPRQPRSKSGSRERSQSQARSQEAQRSSPQKSTPYADDNDGDDVAEHDPETHDPDTFELNAMFLPKRAHPQWERASMKRFEDGSHVKRELGRKVWYALLSFDWCE